MSLPRELGKAKASKIFARAVRQIARDQPAGRRADLPVRRARCVVRRRPAGVPLRPGLELSPRSAGFIAAWTIGYGVVQAMAPALVRRSADGLARGAGSAAVGRPAGPGSAVAGRAAVLAQLARPDLVVAAGLAVFGFAFAVISSLHSYLILAYAGSEKAAEDVGFYYAANAAGRFAASCCRVCCTAGRARGLPRGIRRHARHMLGDDPRFADAAGCRWRRGWPRLPR